MLPDKLGLPEAVNTSAVVFCAPTADSITLMTRLVRVSSNELDVLAVIDAVESINWIEPAAGNLPEPLGIIC